MTVPPVSANNSTNQIGITTGCDLYDDEYCIKIDEYITGKYLYYNIIIETNINCFKYKLLTQYTNILCACILFV